MKKNLVLLFTFGLVALMSASCSDDDYDSLPPRFSDMTFRSLSGSETFKAGDSILATLECSQCGKLLVNATQKWSAEGGSVKHSYMQKGIYNELPVSPVDTLVFSTPGRYKVVFNAEYTTGGQRGMTSSSKVPFADGNGSVSYSVYGAALFHYEVTAEKYITVR